jgi:hypothetical protein
MPTLINQTRYFDIYGNQYNQYTSNAGDKISVRIDFSNCCCITSTTTQQVTYSALTGEVKITEGSWIDEGFRVGDIVTFEGFNQANSGTGIYTLTIIAIPTDKIIVVTGLPSANNATPPTGHIWQFWVNKQKEEMELSINWLENQNTSQTPSMNSLIDNESQRLILTSMNTLPVTNGAGAGVPFVQVGKRSGSFTISNPKIYRFNDDTFGGATRYNYSILFDVIDLGILFPTSFQGSECLKFASKLALKTKSGDTKTSDLYITDNGNTGFFDEAFNSNVTNVTLFPISTNLSYNTTLSIPFQITVNTTSINSIEIGACYSTIDDNYNENQLQSQNKYLKLLKSGLINASNINNTFTSESFGNEYYTIKLQSLVITTSGSTKTFTGSLQFNPRYFNNPSFQGFGDFINAKGDSDRLFYVWLKVGNTNCLLFGGQLSFQFPVGEIIKPVFDAIINHDDNTNHSDMLQTGFIDAKDINIEDDLAYVADIALYYDDDNSAVQMELVCITNTNQEFSLEKMVYDISNQDLNNWVNMFQNVSNNLPTSSAKKQSYLKMNDFNEEAGVAVVRLYYPFIIRWEYWIKQLNASAYYVSTNKNNKNWINYTDAINGGLYIKWSVIHDGIQDYYPAILVPVTYDWDTNVVSTIELIDAVTLASANSIVKGNKYIIKATHIKLVGNWSSYPYGQITVEAKESAPRYMISTEIDADISPLNPLTGNTYKRLDVDRPNAQTVIYKCNFDATNIPDVEYCFTSKISDQGINNNPIFELKITEDNIVKETEDSIEKQIE